MDFRKRLEWLAHLGLLVFILCAVAFLSAVTTIRIALRSNQSPMPNLVGKQMVEAGRLLSDKGLGLIVADRVYDALPAGSIIRQSPPAGMEVKSSQSAHVVVSLGPIRVAIPPLESLSLRTARISLLQAGLQLGEVSAPYMDDATSDSVLIQSQRAGLQASSPKVDVLAPLGPHPVSFVMPFFIGILGSDAQRDLTNAGVKNIRIIPVPAIQWPQGTVIDQSPSAGSRLSAEGPVEIRIAQPIQPVTPGDGSPGNL
jgi:beta-lactam-binding protein with PASTA domain